MPVSLENNCNSACHLGKILPVPLGSNCASVTGNNHSSASYNQLFQCHLGTIVPASFGVVLVFSLGTSVSREQLGQFHFGPIVAVPLSNNHGFLSWEHVSQCHLRRIMPVSLGNSHTSLTWQQTYQCHFSVRNRYG